jgi:hypothetical protein
MTYATELLQLAKRISPAKSDPEIKEYFRVGLITDVRIKMEEDPANDNLPLYEYINKAVRFEQILDHIANISGLPRGLYARKGQINAIAGAPRRGNLQSTYRQSSQKDAKPRKGTPAWKPWCRKHTACFECGSTEHVVSFHKNERNTQPTTATVGRPRGKDGRFRGKSQSFQAQESGKAKGLGDLEASTKSNSRASATNYDGHLKTLGKYESAHRLFTIQPPAANTRMCTLTGKVKIHGRTRRINVLVDSGADVPYVNDTLREDLHLPLEGDGPLGIVQMADGRRSNVAGTARIPLEIGDYKETIEARVVDLADFDMVLGLSWLQSANPSIDWKAMAITVIDGSGKPHTLPLGQPYNLIQVLRTPAAENEFLLMGWDKSTKKVVQQKSANDLEDAYLYVVRSVQPPAENRKQR